MSSEQHPPRDGDPEAPATDAAIPDQDGMPTNEAAAGTPAPNSPAPNSQSATSPGTSAPVEAPASRDVTVRRAPRFAPFMGMGVLVGVIVAAVVAYAGPGDPTLTRESIFGFFIMVFAIPGLLLGALLVLVLDRISIRRSRRAVAQRTYDDESQTD